MLAHQREVIDAERHRIARELHDSVTQYVLSAGHGRRGRPRRGRAPRVGRRRDQRPAADREELSQQAVEQLRRAIYALHQPHTDTVKTLPELLARGAAHHHSQSFETQLRVEGDVIPLAGDADHEIARAVGEALFNVAAHAQASRVIVRLRYRAEPDHWSPSPTTASATRSSWPGCCACRADDRRPTGGTAGWSTSTPDRRHGRGDRLPPGPPRRGARRDAPAPPARRDQTGIPALIDGLVSPMNELRPDGHAGTLPKHDERTRRRRHHARRRPRHRPAGTALDPRARGRPAGRRRGVVGRRGLAVVGRADPQIVLLDLKLSTSSDTEGLELCAELTSAHPGWACWFSPPSSTSTSCCAPSGPAPAATSSRTSTPRR